jgi:hypothetical protein
MYLSVGKKKGLQILESRLHPMWGFEEVGRSCDLAMNLNSSVFDRPANRWLGVLRILWIVFQVPVAFEKDFVAEPQRFEEFSGSFPDGPLDSEERYVIFSIHD